MSLAYKRLNPVLVTDPITDVQRIKDYAIVRGGDKISWKAYTSTSVTASSMQFTTPPPSNNTIVDRLVYISVPIRITLNGPITTNNAAYVPPTSLVNAHQDGPRCWPFSGSVDTLRLTLGNDSVSINMADVIHPLLHYHINNQLKSRGYSMTPDYPDQSQNYSDLYGSTRSPLAFYADGIDGIVNQRGGFPYTVVQNTAVVPSLGGTQATTIIDMVVTEPIWLSPLYYGPSCGDDQGLYNLTSIDWNFTMLASAYNRMWSHDSITAVSTSGADSVFSNITSGSVQFNSFASPPFSYDLSTPQLLFKYITPNVLSTG